MDGLLVRVCSDESCLQSGIRSLEGLAEHEKAAAFNTLKQAASGRDASSVNAANLLVGWFVQSRTAGLGNMYDLARKVAESGHYVSGDVYYLLAQCHLEALCGQEHDAHLALHYLRMAAGKGNAKAINNLVPHLGRDTEEGRTTVAALQRLAEAGDLRSMHNVAVLHGTGWFGQVDNDLARHWYHKASAKGDRTSLFSLGRMMVMGVGGEQNPALGYALITLAADAGEPNASRYIRDKGTASIDDAQVAALRRQWLSINALPVCFVPGRCPNLHP
ncbi:tetratricopeptide repeat protein [Niveispirillum fermenti]|uniref:tetratricopeptide repeat protein n=1 Tax=Niveispirillum fermenti TaxID=1233113 RepID=UPI003A835655